MVVLRQLLSAQIPYREKSSSNEHMHMTPDMLKGHMIQW